MTTTQPAPAPSAPVRTYPSRRDPGRGGRSRPAAEERPTPATAPAAPAAAPAAATRLVRTVAPVATQHVRTVAPVAHVFPHAHVFGPTHTPEPRRTAPERSASHPSGRKTARKGRVPSRWASIGVGLTVAVASTTTLTAVAPQVGSPEADDRPTTGALDALTSAAAAAVDDRDGAASRSAARGAVRTKVAGGTQLTISDKDTMSVETLDGGKIAPAPPVLPGCDGKAVGSGSNGLIASSELCTLWDGHTQVRADAAVALAELNEAYKAAWGESMCITDGFRSYSQQVATKANKGYLAATPGKSNHGWGLAIDICPETYAGARWDWLAANAPAFGWDNPDWARTGGSKYEPWHWEWTAAVAQMGGY